MIGYHLILMPRGNLHTTVQIFTRVMVLTNLGLYRRRNAWAKGVQMPAAPAAGISGMGHSPITFSEGIALQSNSVACYLQTKSHAIGGSPQLRLVIA